MATRLFLSALLEECNSMATYLSTTPVVHADAETRGAFLVKVYQHLLLAVGAFIAFEAVLFGTGIAEGLYNFLAETGGLAWLAILGGFMIVNMLATRSAHQLDNPLAQYGALGAIALAEAVIFAPFLYLVFSVQGSAPVWQAAVVTALGFAGLSAIGLTTRRDLSFVRPLVMWGGFVAIGLIVAAVVFGLHLGVWFSVAMIGLAGGSILYQTQSILRQYPSWAYVGAAVGLFSSLMMMFWYVLRLFSRN